MSGSSSMISTFCNRIPSIKLHWPGRRLDAARRNQYRKAAAATGRALKLNLAFVRFDDVLDEREAEAAPLRVMHEAGADAIELLEYLLLLRARNADAGIGHFDGDEAVAAAHAHIDLLHVVGILDRV